MAAAIKIGTIFAGYRIEGVLGRGGMGVVYLAEQHDLGRRVAIKVIAPALASDPNYLERFSRESRLAAAIEHPNAIPIYEAGVADDEMPYLVMRYVEGEVLSSLLRREGRLETRRAAAIVDQIAGALDEAHARGLVHRDVKPANVIVESRRGTEHAYLTDFGLTREMDASSGVTATGRWVGTIDYASPEQIKGRPVDARCDVYALGCVLFTSLTGRLPFERDEDVAKLYAHVSEPPPAASSVVDGVPPEVDRVISRAMAKDPDYRFPSAGDLGRAAMAPATGIDVAEPEHSVATGGAAPATQPSPGAAPTPTKPSEPPPSEPASTVEAHTSAAGPPKRAGAVRRRRRLVGLVGVVAVGAAVAIALVLSSGGGGGGTTSSATGNGGSGNAGDLPKMVPFTGANAFTVDVPKGSQPTVTEQPVGPETTLTVLLSPDRKMNVQVVQEPEQRPSVLASNAGNLRTGEHATGVSTHPVKVAGRDAYLLRYVHDEPAEHNLPNMGQVAVANYLFSDAGFSWRTRAAVETSVKDAPKQAQDTARAMAESFKPTG